MRCAGVHAELGKLVERRPTANNRWGMTFENLSFALPACKQDGRMDALHAFLGLLNTRIPL